MLGCTIPFPTTTRVCLHSFKTEETAWSQHRDINGLRDRECLLVCSKVLERHPTVYLGRRTDHSRIPSQWKGEVSSYMVK